MAMVSAAETFIRDIHSGHAPYWISLLGSSGAGKTMLAERIVRWGRKHQERLQDPRFNPEHHIKYRDIRMFRWSRCVERMLEGDYGWVREAKEDWLVCCDDIGAEYDKIKSLAISKLYEITEARRGLWTIFTANKSLEQVAQMDGRISSRMLRDESVVIEVDVQDYNLRKFQQQKQHHK